MFPRDEIDLEKIATLLIPPLERDLFDDELRFYYIYLIIEAEGGDFTTTHHVSEIYDMAIMCYNSVSLPGKSHLVHHRRGEEDIPSGHNRMYDNRRADRCSSVQVRVQNRS